MAESRFEKLVASIDQVASIYLIALPSVGMEERTARAARLSCWVLDVASQASHESRAGDSIAWATRTCHYGDRVTG